MLKTIKLSDRPVSSRNDGSKSASSKNNNSRPASKRNDGDGEVNGFGIGDNGVKHTKKLGKSKGKKLSKSQKSAKLGKNLSKNRNSPNFNAKNNGSSFLTPKAKAIFNRLWLALTKTPILQHFDPKCQIWIETNA